MMKNLLVISCLLIAQLSYTQVIPQSRRVDWTLAGYPGNINYPQTMVDVTAFGATGNGVTNDQPAIMAAINSLGGSAGIVYFPPGTYLMTSGISLPDSVILRGVPYNQSVLKFNMGGANLICISVHGIAPAQYTAALAGYTKGSKKIKVADPSQFAVGDLVELRQDNGSWDTNPASWAAHAVGQVSRITQINGDTIRINEPLRIDYSGSLNPEAGKFTPKREIGIETLKIERVDDSPSYGPNNISFSYAYRCWVKGVESDKSVGSHIVLRSSTNIEISGCYFHHAFAYDGTANHGYGVTLNNHSGLCLVENNIFEHLRHAMMVKVGANGNVFGYNYSTDVYRSEWPHNYSGDISLHGHYSFCNLFESNIVQNIITDHAWGPSGPYNTFFRNRAELFGIFITSGTQTTNDQNYVGNELTNFDLFMGQYSLNGSGHFEYGNNVRGTITPSGTNYLADMSYYYVVKPDFWDENMAWPSIGIPNLLNSGTIQAELRFQNGHYTYILPEADAGFDVVIQQGGSVQLNGSVYGGIEPFSIQWTPTTGLDNPNILVPTASPSVTTTYTLTATDSYGVETSDQVTVLVEPYIPQVYFNIKAYLDGPYDNGFMTTALNSQTLIPLSQPYNGAPWFYSGPENVAAIPNGDVTDWVLLELRETTGSASTAVPDSVVARQACFILNDGSIKCTDGSTLPVFELLVTDNLYAVVWHRNHLQVMSATPLVKVANVYHYDFTTGASQAHGGNLAHTEIAAGVWGMTGADGNADGQVTNNDKIEVWVGQSGSFGYLSGDFNCDGQVNNGDKNDVWAPNGGSGSQVPD